MKNLPYNQIAKYLAGESSEIEKQELEQWIHDHPKEMAEITAIWKKTNADNAFENVDDALDKVNSRIDKLETKKIKSRNKKRLILYGVGIAASFLLLFTVLNVTNVLNTKLGNTDSETKLISFSTMQDEVKEVILSDGSKITLNGSSTIEYLGEFKNDKREVHLEGEAFFNITPDVNRPFIIHANNTETRVLGTSFGIRALEKENDVVVTVATGVVSFSTDKNKIKVELKKGEQAYYESTSKKIEKNEKLDPNFLAWQTKVLTFNDTPLSKVATLTQEVYHTPISVDPSIQDLRLTSTFEKLDLEELIQIIELSLDVEAKKTDNGIFFTKK